MNRVDSQYQDLLTQILEFGEERNDRTGTGTLSIFGASFEHCMCNGFPILTTKKMPLKTIATELKWFLKGDTNIKYLLENNCHIWDGDAYKLYERTYSYDLDEPLPMNEFIDKIKTDDTFAKTWGELGPIYGKQWRDWKGRDQIQKLITDLKENPHGRRHLVSAWNVDELESMTLPPCHYGFQCYVSNDGKLSLMWNQRSVDVFLGLPFNITSYAMLLLLLCEETGYKPGTLLGSFGDVHLYKNHLEPAKELLNRVGYPLPDKMEITNCNILEGEFDYKLEGYESHPTIKAKLSN